MDRFRSVRNQDHYETLQAHPLVEHLRGKLWHVTSTTNLTGILTDGHLKPNDGTVVGVFARKGPRLTACERLDGVSLFDFTRPDSEIFPLLEVFEAEGEYFLEWAKFLWWYKPVSVILTFQPSLIAQGLLPSAECKRVGGQWIYNVEVCHHGPIPIDAVSEVITVQAEGPRRGQFEVQMPPRGLG